MVDVICIHVLLIFHFGWCPGMLWSLIAQENQTRVFGHHRSLCVQHCGPGPEASRLPFQWHTSQLIAPQARPRTAFSLHGFPMLGKTQNMQTLQVAWRTLWPIFGRI